MLPMTERFAADIRHYIDYPGPGPGPVRERREQGPDRQGLPGRPQRRGADPVRRRGPGEDPDLAHPAAHGTRRPAGAYPWLCQEQAMVNHWYFYGFDADFGPFYMKFCGYFPFTGQIYLNGHEYAMRQCAEGRASRSPPWTTRSAAPRPGGGAADLRRADRSEDLPVRRQVAGPAAAPVHAARTRRPTTAGSCRSSRSSSPPPWRWTGPCQRADLLRAADPRQHRYRPPGQGEHRLRPH